MEQNNRKILIVAVGLALITSVLIFSYIKKIETANQNIEFVNVFVAAKNISAKTPITTEDIKIIKLEKALINKNALLDQEKIIGKISKENIYEGEQILSSRLAENDNSSLAYQIPRGKRAITINVNEASVVGYFVRPGDFVDIVVTFQKDVQDEKDKQIIIPKLSKTLLQNVQVLGVGQEKDLVDKITGQGDKKDQKNTVQNSENTKTITLAVTPGEAEKVALSEEEGILKLILRPVGDDGIINSVGVVKGELIPADKKIIINK